MAKLGLGLGLGLAWLRPGLAMVWSGLDLGLGLAWPRPGLAMARPVAQDSCHSAQFFEPQGRGSRASGSRARIAVAEPKKKLGERL